jgi:putative membrane protein
VKRLAYVLGLAGLAAAIVLVARAGWHAVLDAVAAAGWPLLWLVPLRVVAIGLDALGWRVLLAPRDPRHRAGWPVLLAAAAVREAVNRLLPVAGVGGELVGIRIVIRRGLEPASVATSVIAEVVLTVLNLVLFAALGLALLTASARDTGSLDSILVGVLLALPIPLAGLWLISEGRLVAWLHRFASVVAGNSGQALPWLQSMPAFEAELSALARRRGRLALAALWQLAGMIVGASEVWLALKLLGHPVGVVTALIIESVVLFVRNLAFAVPAGLGAQEAGIVLICAAVGLDQEAAIGLALAKRMREVLFGLPALLGWHAWETFGGAPLLPAGSARQGRE